MVVFKVSEVAALLSFSLFLLGLSFGPILAAPLSESFSRTATYTISMPLFAIFTLSSGWAQTFGALMACRLLAGIFASPPLVVGAGTNADLWKPESRASMTTFFALYPCLGPASGSVIHPLIGGFAVANKCWR
ncbi:major facilitator superfamily domain-containing protein [Halenospora varia]|nr:major facilitator superfamily domain-containing protein [Halenospora varia]